jgi:Flp pilus assembly protein TadG
MRTFTRRALRFMRSGLRGPRGLGQNSLGRRLWSGEEGAELVEFAVGSLILFTVVFGIIELSLVFFMWNTAAESAREASRWASVRGTDCSNPNITDGSCTAGVGASAAQIQSYAKSLPGAASMTVSVKWCDSSDANCGSSTAAPGHIVQVNVAYTFLSVPFIGKGGLTVSSTSQSVIW